MTYELETQIIRLLVCLLNLTNNIKIVLKLKYL